MGSGGTVRYLVGDVDRSIAFYKNLGFELAEQWGPAFAMVTKDGLTLWLSGPQSSAARAMREGAIPSPGGWNRIVIEVADLHAIYERYVSEGIEFRSDPVTGPGGTQAVLNDPDGNAIELFEPAKR